MSTKQLCRLACASSTAAIMLIAGMASARAEVPEGTTECICYKTGYDLGYQWTGSYLVCQPYIESVKPYCSALNEYEAVHEGVHDGCVARNPNSIRIPKDCYFRNGVWGG